MSEKKRDGDPTREPGPSEAEHGAPTDPTASFPVAGIGASAGGLDALKRLFVAMPPDPGIAFVVVPHLDPNRESLMVELLAHRTSMPVSEAEEGTAVQPNRVYVIPPGKYLGIEHGVLRLTVPDEPRGPQTAIDFFLRSLARDQAERAIGMILSGTGNHGALGVREIKDAGGMVMVQDPASAEYDQMPRGALSTGQVDYALRPEDMPEALVKYARHSYVRKPDWDHPSRRSEEDLTRILSILRARTKYDFRSYRKNMLMRRVRRRMGLRHIDDLGAYATRLREDPDEVIALYKDLLIGVTAFFREPEAFAIIAQRVAPALVSSTEGIRSVRIWVPGCASGEEAYTIAILMIEAFAAAGQAPNFQIFATDIDEEALEKARQGVYPDTIAGDVSPERLQRFFQRSDSHHLQVAKQLRETVIFAPQNLISDAPFSKLDLISCRNLLIYLEPEVQSKVISLFHFALNEHGYLLLGPSESIGRATDLFETVSKRQRIFQRLNAPRREFVNVPIVGGNQRPYALPATSAAAHAKVNYLDVMHRALVEGFAPASVLVNRKYEILCVEGPLIDYLEFPAGEPTRDLLSLARQGLRTKIRAVVLGATRQHQPVTADDAHVRRDGAFVPCSVTARPLAESSDSPGLILVSFRDRPGSAAEAPAAGQGPRADLPDESELVKQLEYELRVTREDLQNTVEEHESANEELKASNEEVMSMNEELQSANEELETSKEELQSLNEELTTVNSQLEEKVAELETANNDITNLLNSSKIATLFLDNELRIQRFTPTTLGLLNLLATDIGRPISDLTLRLDDGTLLADCRRVLDQLTPIEKDVWSGPPPESLPEDGGEESPRCYLRRILPYRTTENRIEGVVVTFVDITARRSAENRVRRLSEVFIAATDPIFIEDESGRIIDLNPEAERESGYGRDDLVGKSIKLLVPEEEQAHHDELIKRCLAGEDVRNADGTFLDRSGRPLSVLITISRITDGEGRTSGLVILAKDVRRLRHAEEELRSLTRELEKRVEERSAALAESEARFRSIVDNAAAGVALLSPGGRFRQANPAFCRFVGLSEVDLLKKTLDDIVLPEDRKLTRQRLDEATAPGQTLDLETRFIRSDGDTRWGHVTAKWLLDDDGRARYAVCLILDISERQAARADLARVAEEEQRRIGRDLHDGVGQQLTGLGHLAQALIESLPKLEEGGASEIAALHAGIERLARGLGEALDELRSVSRGLLPISASRNLVTALRDLAERTDGTGDVTCAFRSDGAVQIPDQTVATHLYRVAQEAVSNALKHARAKSILIALEKRGSTVDLEVSDDGIGVAGDAVEPPGLGLRSMRYRAQLLGGSVTIARLDAGGTRVICTVPTGGLADDR